MSCNCGKNKGSKTTVPTGFGGQASAGSLTGNESDSTTTQSFTLITTSGATQTFGSRLEAQAARVRAGGGTIQVR